MEPNDLYARQKNIQAWFRKAYPWASIQTIEDFGSYCVEVWLKKGFHKGYKYLAVDFFRIHGTRMNSHGSADALAQPDLLRFKPIHLDQHLKNNSLEEQILPFDIDDVKDIRDRVILVLIIDFGFTHENTAKVIGVSAGRISQIIKEMRKKYTPKKIINHDLKSKSIQQKSKVCAKK